MTLGSSNLVVTQNRSTYRDKQLSVSTFISPRHRKRCMLPKLRACTLNWFCLKWLETHSSWRRVAITRAVSLFRNSGHIFYFLPQFVFRWSCVSVVVVAAECITRFEGALELSQECFRRTIECNLQLLFSWKWQIIKWKIKSGIVFCFDDWNLDWCVLTFGRFFRLQELKAVTRKEEQEEAV